MSDRTRLISPEDAEWDGWLLRAPHDFYHRAAYHAFAERMGEGRAFLVVHGDDRRFMAWPYLVRPAGAADADATSVYGYTGPTGIGLEDADFRHRAWAAFRGVWADQGLVALFTRFHPLLGNDRHCAGLPGAAPVPGGEVLTLGPTVMIDLSHDRETRRMMYPQVLRQEIKRAERAGVVVVEDTDWRHYPEFGALYRATMQKNTAAQGYMFSDDYLAELRAALGDCARLAVARVGEETAAIMLFTLCGTIAQAHLTGISPRHQSLSPLKVLIDGVADICARQGAGVLHLGAGRGGFEDSLFAFKARFSRLRGNFTVGRWILDADRYAALAREAAVVDAEAGTYFPIYRAPRRESA
jgi:hypothetical protein